MNEIHLDDTGLWSELPYEDGFIWQRIWRNGELDTFYWSSVYGELRILDEC